MTWLIAGLGNPGAKYADSVHNAGFKALDSLAADWNISQSSKFNSLLGNGLVAGQKAYLLKPLSFLNLSGGPVNQTAQYFNVDPAELVVVHDDIDLPFGAIKLKRGGGDGGHNGLKSITAALGTNDYYRVRVGVGRPAGAAAGDKNAADFVTKALTGQKLQEFEVLTDDAAGAVEKLLTDGLASAQQRYH